ncbi:MAG: hypothetical protein RJB05_740, partial [Armatimonadota bacterium]
MRISGPVLITGSVSGFGMATARRAIACGADVIIHGIDQASADAVCEELGAALAVSGDLSDQDVPKQLINAIIGKFGSIYGIVNNAANTGRSVL